MHLTKDFNGFWLDALILPFKTMNMNTFTLSDTAAILGIENIGRQKIYTILKELGIVDKYNRPIQKYIDDGYLALGMPTFWHNGERQTYVTLVVGQKSMNFLEKILEDYLKENPPPTISRRKKYR